MARQRSIYNTGSYSTPLADFLDEIPDYFLKFEQLKQAEAERAEQTSFRNKQYSDQIEQQTKNNTYRETQATTAKENAERDDDRADAKLVDDPAFTASYFRANNKIPEANAVVQREALRTDFIDKYQDIMGHAGSKEMFGKKTEIDALIKDGKSYSSKYSAKGGEVQMLSELQKQLIYINKNQGQQMPTAQWGGDDVYTVNSNEKQLSKINSDLIDYKTSYVQALESKQPKQMIKLLLAQINANKGTKIELEKQNSEIRARNRFPTFESAASTIGDETSTPKEVEPPVGQIVSARDEDPNAFNQAILSNPDLADALTEEFSNPGNQDFVTKTNELYKSYIESGRIKIPDITESKPLPGIMGARERMSISGSEIEQGTKEDSGFRIDPDAIAFKLPPEGKDNPEYYDRVMKQYFTESDKLKTLLLKPEQYKGVSPSEKADEFNQRLKVKDGLIKQIKKAYKNMPKTKKFTSQIRNLKELIDKNPTGVKVVFDKEARGGKGEFKFIGGSRDDKKAVEEFFATEEEDKDTKSLMETLSPFLGATLQANPRPMDAPEDVPDWMFESIIE